MTHDPLTFYAWASRPTGPLSDLYMTGEQTETVYRWLSSILSHAREDVSGLSDEAIYRDGYAAALRDAVAAIEAVDPPSEGYDDWYPKGKRYALAAIEALGGE